MSAPTPVPNDEGDLVNTSSHPVPDKQAASPVSGETSATSEGASTHNNFTSLPYTDAYSTPGLHSRTPMDILPNEEEPLLLDLSNVPGGFASHEPFLYYRDIVSRWCMCWGGIEQWPRYLALNLDIAREKGPEAIALFFRRLWNQEQRGRYLLHATQLHTSDTLPSNHQALITFWNLLQEQVKVLTRGLTILELTASITERSMFSIGGDQFLKDVQTAQVAPNTALYSPSRRREKVKHPEQEDNREQERNEEDSDEMAMEEIAMLCTDNNDDE